MGTREIGLWTNQLPKIAYSSEGISANVRDSTVR